MQLSDILWPDADGDLAATSFSTTIHRLRKLLGVDYDVLIVSDNHISINSDYCWVDVWSFRDIINGFEFMSALSEEDEQKIDSLYKKVLNIYRGNFLSSDHDHLWAAYQRDCLKDEFIGFCYKVGAFYESINKYTKGLECYKRVLIADNLREECYRRTIMFYLRAGLKAEALTQYNKCKHVFETVLGVSPSLETEKLLESIMKVD
jgi:DNA-binding SARP family transcriptional activator